MDVTIPEVRQISKHDQTKIKRIIGKVTGDQSKFFTKFFGCETCPYRGTDTCPHSIPEGGKHANGICSFRTKELQELYDAAGSVPRLFQQDAIVKSQILLDHFREEYAKTENLHPNFHQLERNLHNLLDKTRRQDEGIKISGEITVTHDKLRQIVDAQAQKVIEAEVTDAEGNKQQIKNASIFRDRKDTELEGST